jgi:hypothetical protein
MWSRVDTAAGALHWNLASAFFNPVLCQTEFQNDENMQKKCCYLI